MEDDRMVNRGIFIDQSIIKKCQLKRLQSWPGISGFSNKFMITLANSVSISFILKIHYYVGHGMHSALQSSQKFVSASFHAQVLVILHLECVRNCLERGNGL